MLSETASTCPSTFTVVDNTTCIVKVKNWRGELAVHKVGKVTVYCLADFPMANKRWNRILGQGHALGISTGHPPPVIMAELPGKRGHTSLGCCYLFAFKACPGDGVG